MNMTGPVKHLSSTSGNLPKSGLFINAFSLNLPRLDKNRALSELSFNVSFSASSSSILILKSLSTNCDLLEIPWLLRRVWTMYAACWNDSNLCRISGVLRGVLLDITSLSTCLGCIRADIMATLPPVENPSMELLSILSCCCRFMRSDDICLTLGLTHLGELPWFLASGIMTVLLVRWWIFLPMLT